MKEKSEASQLLRNLCKMAITQLGAQVKMVRSDTRMEFTSNPIKQFYSKQGIIHQMSCMCTPQQNAWVESKYRHILNVA